MKLQVLYEMLYAETRDSQLYDLLKASIIKFGNLAIGGTYSGDEIDNALIDVGRYIKNITPGGPMRADLERELIDKILTKINSIYTTKNRTNEALFNLYTEIQGFLVDIMVPE